MMIRRILTCCFLLIGLLVCWPERARAELLVGASSVEITPTGPVAVTGQFRLRVAHSVETPLTANVIVLESRTDGKTQDVAVMVSCDLIYIPDQVLGLVRAAVHRRVLELDPKKIFLNATHTHTAPVLLDDKYVIPKAGVVQVDAYRHFLAQRVAEAVARAWQGRRPGRVSWGLGHAVVAYNRRAVYADHTAKMYGATNVDGFRHIEGYEDHDIGTLFFWNEAGQLIAVAVNVSCPSQEVESREAVNADFWQPVRQALRARYGKQLCVLGWTGAAGDQSPHLMYRKAADERMRRLRGLTRLEEIARRIVRAVDEAYEVVKKDQHDDVRLVHQVATIRLPMRWVTEVEYAEAKAICTQYAARIEKNPKVADRLYRKMKWYEGVVERFDQQRSGAEATYPVELHVLRIGDAAVCTNSFELFTDFGVQIKARSKAVQTFVIQLAGPGTYVPTARAVRGGSYSATVESNPVGPEGGQILVDQTVQRINTMWASSK